MTMAQQTMIQNAFVDKDLAQIYATKFINWERFNNKTILITGVTGGIGSLIARAFLYVNKKANLNITVVGLVRDMQRAKTFFGDLVNDNSFRLVLCDITAPITYDGKVDYIIHCANNTSSRSFVEFPVETMQVAFCGTKNVLDLAHTKQIESMVYLSSVEIYGHIDSTTQTLTEDMLGTLELLNTRNSYPIGKRAAETLCYSYYKEKNIPVKNARLAQTVGANVNYDDTRVYAHFARSIVEKRDIVLNTPGNTIRSYCYITDAIAGIILLLQAGENGEAYNIGNEDATSKIKDIAQMLANKYPNSKLVFNINNTNIYPKETNWALNTYKIRQLGWYPQVSQAEMYDNLINSFCEQAKRIGR